MFCQTQTACTRKGRKCWVFLSLVTLNFDLQTRPSQGPNTSSMWIWHKSTQQFPRYFIHNKKPQTDSAKNRTFHSSLHAVINIRICQIWTAWLHQWYKCRRGSKLRMDNVTQITTPQLLHVTGYVLNLSQLGSPTPKVNGLHNWQCESHDRPWSRAAP